MTKTYATIMALTLFAGMLIGLFMGFMFGKNQEKIQLKTSSELNIKYKIVEIENKQWIATPAAHGYWNVSGPLNVLTIEPEKNN